MTRSTVRGNVTAWVLIAIVLAVIVGGAAGLAAYALFSGIDTHDADREAESILRDALGGAVSTDPAPAPELVGPPQPKLAGPGERERHTRMQQRIDALEGEVAALKRELSDMKAKAGPLLEMLAKEHPGGIVLPPGRLPEGLELPPGVLIPGGIVDGPDGTAAVAKKLGLDPRRTAAMAEEYEQVMAEIEALEKQHATVTRIGDTTTIAIDRYAGEGDRVGRRWDDWLDANLTTEERTTYDGAATTNRLLGNRLGGAERTITIKEADGSVTIKDATGGEGGSRTMQQIQGPAIARDAMLAPYGHLLK